MSMEVSQQRPAIPLLLGTTCQSALWLPWGSVRWFLWFPQWMASCLTSWCCRVNSVVDVNILQKHTVAIFSPEDKRMYVSAKQWHLSMSLHGTKTLKNIIIMSLSSSSPPPPWPQISCTIYVQTITVYYKQIYVCDYIPPILIFKCQVMVYFTVAFKETEN
jgi:hypothetical protein